jgi:predicted metalloprotease with PDZ domain
VFGKVLPESEPGVALLLGQHASREAMYSDWILVHELFHLGFPSFVGEGKWLDEGLATYYEPVIRVRAGLYTETELWNEWLRDMPQGLPAFTQHGLNHADDFRGIYWGGAIACFVADVRARQRQLNRGLEVGLRAVRDAGGVANDVWTLAEVVGAVDHALGAPTLAPIVEGHAQHGSPFDLAALFAALGVTRDAQGAVQLSDSAPLASVRRAITASP